MDDKTNLVFPLLFYSDEINNSGKSTIKEQYGNQCYIMIIKSFKPKEIYPILGI